MVTLNEVKEKKKKKERKKKRREKKEQGREGTRSRRDWGGLPWKSWRALGSDSTAVTAFQVRLSRNRVVSELTRINSESSMR